MALEDAGLFVRLGLFIQASSATTAQRVLDLIWASLHVVKDGYLPLDEYPSLVPPAGQVPPRFGGDDLAPMRTDRWATATGGIAGAVQLAARVSRRRDLTNALHALAFSQGLACMHHMDLDPIHWRHGSAVSPYPKDHFRLAYAIVAAYSVLEHLGLAIQASTAKPSRPQGVWNPEVRRDLERRLTSRGVDMSESALWTVRGTPRRTDRDRPTQPLRKAEWAWGRVRDQEVPLVDAIADVSWLRSRVASHRLGTKAPSLTAYDVANGQYLARRLLLSAVGMWRTGEVSPERRPPEE